MARFAKALNHAKNFWFAPCQDNRVFLKRGPISVSDQFGHFKVSPSEWIAVFLFYDGFDRKKKEGLFLVPAADFTIPKLVAHNSQSGANDWSDFPNFKFVCSWFDAFPEAANGVQPRFNGLDDCAHYVSECLEKEGIHCATPSAPQLVQTLRSRHDTKTLADLVDPLRAKLMIDGAVVKDGDLVFYGLKENGKKVYWHSSMMVDSTRGLVTTHTFCNHSEVTDIDPSLPSDWQVNINTDHHQLVTIIHFSLDDRDNDPTNPLLGFWTLSGAGTFYYRFDNFGRVIWFNNPPKNPAQQPNGRGYWFKSIDWEGVKICWTDTGTFEGFLTREDGSNTVVRNGIPQGTAVRGIVTP
jgi:hypothetical protein